jgi:hypothetical protein
MAGLVQIKGYLLKPETSLFKGDDSKYLDQYLKRGTVSYNQGQPAYFAFDKESAMKYGVIFEFKIRSPIFLVDLVDVDVMKQIYEIAGKNKNIQKIMRDQYGYRPDTNTIEDRNSEHTKDDIFSQFLCSIGIKGYALSEQMKTDLGGTFHREVMLCDPSMLELTGLVGFPVETEEGKEIMEREPSAEEIAQITERVALKRIAREDKKRHDGRKKRPKKHDDDDDKPWSSPSGKLFGDLPDAESPTKHFNFDSPSSSSKPSPAKKNKKDSFSTPTK